MGAFFWPQCWINHVCLSMFSAVFFFFKVVSLSGVCCDGNSAELYGGEALFKELVLV